MAGTALRDNAMPRSALGRGLEEAAMLRMDGVGQHLRRTAAWDREHAFVDGSTAGGEREARATA